MAIITATIIGAVVLMTALVMLVSDANNWSKSLTCQYSVKFRSATVFLGASAIGKDYHLRCPVIEDKVTQEQLYQTISEEMIRCWNNVGAGQETLTDNYDVGRRDVACLVCAQIMPKDGDKELTVNPQELKNYLNKIGDEKKKGVLAQLTDTTANLDYTYSKPQTVTQSKPFTIAYFIYASDVKDLKNTAEVKPSKSLSDEAYAGTLGASSALSTLIVTQLAGKKLITGLFSGGIVGIVVTTGAEAAFNYAQKEVLVHGIFYGTGGDVESQCTSYL